MWELHTTAKTWSTRPSSLLEIKDPYTAYCVDEAVAAWGNFIENELASVEGKTSEEVERKQIARLDQLLGRQQAKGRFRDPADMFNT